VNLSEKSYNTIFISSCDHYSGTPNHGLFQMFLYFKNILKEDCAFLCTHQKRFKHEDSYDISSLGGGLPLSHQINIQLVNIQDPRTWNESKQYKNSYNPDLIHSENIDNILNNLPKHKNVILGDRVDVGDLFLSKILTHFKSKLILVTMVHNAHTGKCAFPHGQYGCDKYKHKEGCFNCPDFRDKVWSIAERYDNETEENKRIILDSVYKLGKISSPQDSFISHDKFVKRHKDSMFLNAGSSYSLEQANQSYLYKDVQKEIIPLKTVKDIATNKEQIIGLKKANKEIISNMLNNFDHPLMKINNIDMSKINNICHWSSFDPTSRRKGMKEFIDSLFLLKSKYMTEEEYNSTLFIISGAEKKAALLQSMFPENTKFIFTGFVDSESIKIINLASDVFCCTTLEDAGPRTVPESVVCGTPVVSFDRCIAKDLVTNKNGRIVETGDVDSFAKGISEILLSSDEDKEKMSYECIRMYQDFYDDKKICEKWRKVLN
jgi:glycosyltransferase involved in cell wall biosynthesis